MATYTGTIPSGVLAVGAGLPAAWTQQVGLSLSALESAWTTYTPTLAGAITIGNGVLAGRYTQVGKLIMFRASVTFGTTTTMGTGLVNLGLPVASNTTTLGHVINSLIVGPSFYLTVATLASTTADIRLMSSTAGLLGNFTSTTPFTWASTHSIQVSGTYEAA